MTNTKNHVRIKTAKYIYRGHDVYKDYSEYIIENWEEYIKPELERNKEIWHDRQYSERCDCCYLFNSNFFNIDDVLEKFEWHTDVYQVSKTIQFLSKDNLMHVCEVKIDYSMISDEIFLFYRYHQPEIENAIQLVIENIGILTKSFVLTRSSELLSVVLKTELIRTWYDTSFKLMNVSINSIVLVKEKSLEKKKREHSSLSYSEIEEEFDATDDVLIQANESLPVIVDTNSDGLSGWSIDTEFWQEDGLFSVEFLTPQEKENSPIVEQNVFPETDKNSDERSPEFWKDDEFFSVEVLTPQSIPKTIAPL